MVKEHHPDRFKAKTREEGQASPEPEKLEASLIKMKRLISAYEGLSGAFELKAQGWFGVFIIRHCEGRSPQEHSVTAHQAWARVLAMKSREAQKLQSLHSGRSGRRKRRQKKEERVRHCCPTGKRRNRAGRGESQGRQRGSKSTKQKDSTQRTNQDRSRDRLSEGRSSGTRSTPQGIPAEQFE